MTSQGRAVIAVVALIAGVALVALGSLAPHGASATTAGASMMTAVVGYAFGDRNGEKRLAAAMTVLQADEIERAPRPARAKRATSPATPGAGKPPAASTPKPKKKAGKK